MNNKRKFPILNFINFCSKYQSALKKSLSFIFVFDRCLLGFQRGLLMYCLLNTTTDFRVLEASVICIFYLFIFFLFGLLKFRVVTLCLQTMISLYVLDNLVFYQSILVFKLKYVLLFIFRLYYIVIESGWGQWVLQTARSVIFGT